MKSIKTEEKIEGLKENWLSKLAIYTKLYFKKILINMYDSCFLYTWNRTNKQDLIKYHVISILKGKN